MALKQLCSSDAARKAALEEVIARHGIEGTPALGVTRRDVAKGLPIRLLHGGDYEAWMRDNELAELPRAQWPPLMRQLEEQLAACRREVCEYVQRNDAEWYGHVVTAIRAKRQARPRRPGGGTREQRAQEARETRHAAQEDPLFD